jgi:hypothetical protein
MSSKYLSGKLKFCPEPGSKNNGRLYNKRKSGIIILPGIFPIANGLAKSMNAEEKENGRQRIDG